MSDLKKAYHHIDEKFKLFNDQIKTSKTLTTSSGTIYDCGFNSETFNTLSLFEGEPKSKKASAEAALKHFGARNFCVWGNDAAPLPGLIYEDASTILTLSSSDLLILDKHNSDIFIKKVESHAELLIFSEMLADLFPPEEGKSLRHVYENFTPGNSAIEFYIGFWRGKPVATAALFIINNVASLWEAFTLPEFRRRGISSALIQARYKSIRQHSGIHQIYVYCSPMSLGNFERQGFKALGSAYTFVKPPQSNEF